MPTKTKAAAEASQLKQSLREMRTLMQGRGSFETLQMGSLKQETIETFKRSWLLDSTRVEDVIKKAAQLYRDDPIFGWAINAKISYYGAGFTFQEKLRPWKKTISYPWIKTVGEVWRDWLVCQNVVAFWKTPETGLPPITLLKAHEVQYQNQFGVESLKFKPEKQKLTARQKEELGPRYSDAIENGKWLELDPNLGENFKVLTTASLGEGLAMPKVRGMLQDFATAELLRMGDWNGAWARKNIMRHAKKGHDIKGGTLQGMPQHFFKSEFGKKLMKHLAGISGYSEFASNFDLIFEYVYLGAEFFDPKAHESTLNRIERWAGPVALMLKEGATPSPYLQDVLMADGLHEREIVTEFLESIFNHPSFLSKVEKPPEEIRVKWDDTIFMSAKQALAWIGQAQQNGLASFPTARRLMRLDNDEESELMVKSHENPLMFTPPFEAKQGLVGGDGGEGGANPKAGRPANKDT